MTTGVIIGNGPSLANVPLAFLNKYPTIGTNLIYLMDGFTPTYYTAVDPSVMREDYIKRVNKMRCIKVIGQKVGQFLNGCITFSTTWQPRFSTNLFVYPPWEGWSVTYIALQLAFYLKWQTVLLVGVDHRYEGEGRDHFHPNYDDGWVFEPHDMTKALPAYKMAKFVYEKHGRNILNLTPGSDLKVFEFGDLGDWL